MNAMIYAERDRHLAELEQVGVIEKQGKCRYA